MLYPNLHEYSDGQVISHHVHRALSLSGGYLFLSVSTRVVAIIISSRGHPVCSCGNQTSYVDENLLMFIVSIQVFCYVIHRTSLLSYVKHTTIEALSDLCIYRTLCVIHES